MEKFVNHFLKEEYYKEILDNGLAVYIMPKKNYYNVTGMLMVNYGSFDNEFKQINEKCYDKVPYGVAHFLEHKMFENENSEDVTLSFSDLGVEVNAFTSYDKTAYTFSGTDNINEAIITLLDFVQKPCFTIESVEKEKSIIEQELLMYLDQDKTVARQHILENMYEDDPITIEIGGTVSSIKEINKEILLKCYNNFYHPKNTVLVIVGGVNPNEIINIVKTNQDKKTFPKYKEIIRKKAEYQNQVVCDYSESTFDIIKPIVLVGQKFEFVNNFSRETFKTNLTLELLMDVYFSPTSELVEELKTKNLFDNSFSYALNYYGGYAYLYVMSVSDNIDEFIKTIKNTLHKMINEDVPKDKFLKIQRATQILNIKSLNSISFLTNRLATLHYENMNLFDAIELPSKITYDDLMNARTFLKDELITVHVVNPK